MEIRYFFSIVAVVAIAIGVFVQPVKNGGGVNVETADASFATTGGYTRPGAVNPHK